MNLRRLLAVSAIAHVIVFALAMRIEVPRPVAPPIPALAQDEATIDLATEPIPTAPTATAAPLAAEVVPSSFYGGGAVHEPTPMPSAAPAPSAEPAPYASNGTWVVFGPSLGLGGTSEINPFLGRGALPAGSGTAGAGVAASADPMFVPENKRAEQAVKDALRARDHALGLGPEGPVLSALESATHSGFAPERGTATFLAVINEHGIVIDLKLVASSTSTKAGEHGWEDVRQRAVKNLASAKIDMRGVKRAELQIAVESTVKLPSGRDPNKSAVQPTAKPSVTKVETAAPGSPSGADVVQTATVATFDVTDIGAKPVRVVHAKLISLKTL